MKLFRMILCAALLMSGGIAVGQMKVGDMAVDVPFAFHVAEQEFPAGHYIVAAGDDYIRIFNNQARGVYVPTHSAMRGQSGASKLVFHRYGSSFFLSEVWTQGKTIGRQLFVSGAERELKGRQAEMELAVVQPAK
jgi:hypothetical protein